MATASFINSTTNTIQVRLNDGELYTLEPFSVITSDAGQPSVIKSQAHPYPIKARDDRDVFGADNRNNTLVVTSDAAASSSRYTITTNNTRLLNLNQYYFIFQDQVTGEDQTGSTDGIHISRVN
ncbi:MULTISPECIES: hypothetical protein [Pseudoalteromonas]|uniref:Uncharacterized protein n=1 Tax=Pseudoalteromonas rubra TaxID=43658 RepID=A0A5S3USV5_9GAMM|nr:MULTISPECIES: hypothetical protein [Pseudoalteromonas]MCG7561327.1 hypothetical protein [Pseudoalteromonas sp. McH1-42]MEC4090693.1 hypothetical protein [Pseudoalteromonas rubra]QPB85661.1 hypothetical protein CWC22_021880 [Pseudoalteromonas rubra]